MDDIFSACYTVIERTLNHVCDRSKAEHISGSKYRVIRIRQSLAVAMASVSGEWALAVVLFMCVEKE